MSWSPKEPIPTHHTNVAKLVCSSHSIIVEKAGSSDPSGVGVISKDNELVLITLVTNPDETFLDIRHNYSVPNSLDPRYVIGNMLGKTKTETKIAISIILEFRIYSPAFFDYNIQSAYIK